LIFRQTHFPVQVEGRFMARKKKDLAVCPHCGAAIPGSASACPVCGSDERTGWSDSTYLDEIDLPLDEDEYDEMVAREFGNTATGRSGRGKWIIIAGAVVLIVFLLGYLRVFF
jgi:hypothetical protein